MSISNWSDFDEYHMTEIEICDEINFFFGDYLLFCKRGGHGGRSLESDHRGRRSAKHVSELVERFKLRALLEVNKQQRVTACSSLLTWHLNVPIFHRLLKSNKKWILYDTAKRARHWVVTTERCGWLPPQKKRIYTHGRSYSVEHALKHNEPVLVNHKGVLSLHDNIRPYVACVAMDTVLWFDWETPYSPNIVPTDYRLFHSLDNHLHEKSSANKADLWNSLTDFFPSETPDFLPPRLCANGGTMVNVFGWQWRIRWELMIYQIIVYQFFLINKKKKTARTFLATSYL